MAIRVPLTKATVCGLVAVAVLCGAMSRAGRAAEQPPVQVTSEHFTVVTDAGEKNARHVLDNLERMRWVFQALFPKANVDAGPPMLVLAMKNRKSFEAMEPEEYLKKNQLSLAGLFLSAQDQNYILLELEADGDHPYATVYHEYTHLQYRGAQDWMPLWLTEGVAEFFQNTTIHDKDAQVGEIDGNELGYLRQIQMIPLETLFRVDRNSPYYHQEDKGSAFYAESWALTHMLIINDRKQGTQHLSEYMQLVRRGTDPVSAAFSAFGDLKKLQSALGFYIQQQGFLHFVLNSAAAPIDETKFDVKTLSKVEYDLARARFMAAEGRNKDTQALLDGVIAAEPKNAEARAVEGLMALMADDHATAKKHFGEAVELGSKDYMVNFYFAELSMEGSGTTSTEVEKALRQTIAANPGYAPAYGLLGLCLSQPGGKLDEAYKLLVQAVQLDLHNVSYRVNAANVLAMQGKLDQATDVLEAAGQIARTGAEKAAVRNRLEMVKQEQAIAKEQQGTESGTVMVTLNGKPIENAEVTGLPAPKHPVATPSGPKHKATGTVHKIECTYPAEMELQLEVPAKAATKNTPKREAKTLTLYSSNYHKMDLSALGFEPKAEMNVCKEMDGMRAEIEYTDSADKTVNGQIVSVMLMKP